MNESLDKNIKLGKGKVTFGGHPETFVTLIKANINRKDPMSDKLLYVVDGIELPKGTYAVTPTVSVAVGWVDASDIGIMREDGELLAPMIYSSIVKLNDKYTACNTSSAAEEIEAKKVELTKVQDNAKTSQDIKDKMKKEIGKDLNLLCDDFYAKYDIYEVSENLDFKRVFADASFVSVDKDTIYVHSNKLEDETIIFGAKEKTDLEVSTSRIPTVIDGEQVHLPSDEVKEDNKEIAAVPEIPTEVTESKEEQPVEETVKEEEKDKIDKKLEMPVATFATLDGKVLDSIGDTTQLEAIKPGAPTLINDETEEENKEETEVSENNDVEEKNEEIQKDDKEDKEVAIKTESTNDVFKVKNINIGDKKIISADTHEKMAEMANLVSAVTNKITYSTEKVEELQKENEELKERIKRLEDENRVVTAENKNISNENNELKNIKSAQARTIEQLNDDLQVSAKENREIKAKNIALSSEVTNLQETINQTYNAFRGLLENDDKEEEFSFSKAA